jgi:hypothetical protein
VWVGGVKAKLETGCGAMPRARPDAIYYHNYHNMLFTADGVAASS